MTDKRVFAKLEIPTYSPNRLDCPFDRSFEFFAANFLEVCFLVLFPSPFNQPYQSFVHLYTRYITTHWHYCYVLSCLPKPKFWWSSLVLPSIIPGINRSQTLTGGSDLGRSSSSSNLPSIEQSGVDASQFFANLIKDDSQVCYVDFDLWSFFYQYLLVWDILTHQC